MTFLRVGLAAIVLGVAMLAAVLPGRAQQKAAPQASPQAFLEAIYRPYLNKGFQGIKLDKPAEVRRYFAAALADAIAKDSAAAAKRNEVPTLGGDPFLDAQDWELANLKIAVDAKGADQATGTVSFTNAGKATTVTLDLVKTAAGWRIAEIRSPSGSLRKLMKLR